MISSFGKDPSQTLLHTSLSEDKKNSVLSDGQKQLSKGWAAQKLAENAVNTSPKLKTCLTREEKYGDLAGEGPLVYLNELNLCEDVASDAVERCLNNISQIVFDTNLTFFKKHNTLKDNKD